MDQGKQTFKVLYCSLLCPGGYISSGGYAALTGCMFIVKSFLGVAEIVLKTSVSIVGLQPTMKDKV